MISGEMEIFSVYSETGDRTRQQTNIETNSQVNIHKL